jgi:hypothetical protein
MKTLENTLTKSEIGDEIFYKISNVDLMNAFFMSIVSDSNHWMFISSNGGLSIGRKNAEHALFPYYTDDKITASAENTGSKSIFWVEKNGTQHLWEPFSERSFGKYEIVRNLYKSKFGNQIVFEEINTDLQLSFRYQWSSSDVYGFVRKSNLTNHSDSGVNIRILDGLQNVLPYGVGSALQNSTSNLADAYKRTELIPETGLGIFALSAIIVDKAEPSEALKANVAWSIGLDNNVYLLSSAQLRRYRLNQAVQQEEDIKGDKGAYFVVNESMLSAGDDKEWMIVLNVNQDHAAIVQLSETLKTDADVYAKVLADIKRGSENLVGLAAAADGLQYTADELKDTRHFSNVLFNIMRGGIFDNNYQIEKWDFTRYLQNANLQLFEDLQANIAPLPEVLSVQELKTIAHTINNTNFTRLATEYLPLKFSRRHGDPSRPWNQFSINTRSEVDGSKILDYQGNWRDIFQNWEALAFSYPEFIESMIFKFLNASTFDGYNPYRVTKGGFDWETIEPDNPWSYIGYWGDHQIIYLLKFLEFLQNLRPGYLRQLLDKNGFVYANVPYIIKPYDDIKSNPKDTIAFDYKKEHDIQGRVKKIGADGTLVTLSSGEIYQVCFCEKLLATVLSKLSNFVPDGGIWMNTQRPEWNDANNALVGNGLSMVTLCYLRRFLKFFMPVFAEANSAGIQLSEALHSFFTEVANVFNHNKHLLLAPIDDAARKAVTDALGIAGSNYRTGIYLNGFSGKKMAVSAIEIYDCLSLANSFLEHAIDSNRRDDDLYHTYNLISYNEDTIEVARLSEMLEGQVAVLSSGYLTAEQSLKLLDALKQSALYRKDQNSYILYPNKNLPKFLEKNTIQSQLAEKSLLLKQLLADGNLSIVTKDLNGALHFNGSFRNAADVDAALKQLDQRYNNLVAQETGLMLQLFEDVFCHKAFTGRSGTFFGYEGLGSIYWHMVSKLLLAVEEVCVSAIEQNSDSETVDGLIAHFYDINEGIGVHKPPHLYGAFPTDPYSHTPFNKGAQQPGMTGQVKEDILARIGELGVSIKNGKLVFKPSLLHRNEFLKAACAQQFVMVDGAVNVLHLEPNSLAFTICQVPVVYKISSANHIEVFYHNGISEIIDALELSKELSDAIFQRTNRVVRISVAITENNLR